MTITDVDYPPHWMIFKKGNKLHNLIKNETNLLEDKIHQKFLSQRDWFTH